MAYLILSLVLGVLILVQLDGEGSHMKEVIFRFIWVLILVQLDGEGSCYEKIF